MVQKRFAVDGKTNKNQTCYSGDSVDCDDSIKRTALKGYVKLLKIILLFVAILFLRKYVVDSVNVIGSSMENTFSEGDVLIVKKYDLENIQRYDVVIAKILNQNVIKRVIALPNEKIQIIDGSVFVNDKKIEGEFDFFTEEAGVISEPYVLKENEYFLMGDNRKESADSRRYGSVKNEDIKGIVVFRCFPFDRVKVIAHGEDVVNEAE